MVKKLHIIQVVGGGLLALIVVANPTTSYADNGRNQEYNSYRRVNQSHYESRHHSYPRYGETRFTLSGGNLSLSVGGLRYYYEDGVYYRRHMRQYVVVAPPRGAVIRYLPSSYRPVVIRGATYYTQNDIYYQPTVQGYVLVDQPDTMVYPLQGVPLNLAAGNEDNSFIVNIPNRKGSGYTSVTLKKSGDGYVGPQGEFYADFPKISQLQAMYVN